MLYILLWCGIAILLMALDLAKKGNLLSPVPLTILLLAGCNTVLTTHWLRAYHPAALPAVYLLLVYFWVRLGVFPVRDGHRVGGRLKVMVGGRRVARCAMWAMALEAAFLLFSYPRLIRAGTGKALLIGNGVFALVAILLLFANGSLRMFFTSRRLSVLCRAAMLLTMWIPVANLLVLAWACRLVYEEYDFALYKAQLRELRADSDLCRTRYPLVMVHGILFRDLKYFNYWGRVPGELIRCGATVYYGNQAAVGTVRRNAEDIQRTVRSVLEETGCEKVNIIAHSKGGLDARYAVSCMGLGECVASVTTVGTPHHGCRFVDMACRMLPDSLYRLIAGGFDAVYSRMWKEQPDFYTATRQFATEFSEELNGEMADCEQVYYQSYASKMSSLFSDSLLWLPYCLVRAMEGENDGLVSVESAKWGKFRGVLEAQGRRGVSHGDAIDLKREDIKGFDVMEAYVKIVADLKQMGY